MLPLVLAIMVTLVDQITKAIVRERFDLFEAVSVVPGLFDIRYIQNTGAAWGIFAGGHHWLALLSVGVLIALIFFRHSFFSDGMFDQISFGLIMGGIVGNFIDRMRLNYVVDFLDFYWQDSHFPAFNVADSAICCGVILYLFAQFVETRRRKRVDDHAEAVP